MSPTRRTGRDLAKVAAAGLAVMALGVLLVWLVTPVGWLLVGLGALLLFRGPLAVAWSGSGSAARPDHRVEGRTFMIDLFRSVKWPPQGAAKDREPPSDPKE